MAEPECPGMAGFPRGAGAGPLRQGPVTQARCPDAADQAGRGRVTRQRQPVVPEYRIMAPAPAEPGLCRDQPAQGHVAAAAFPPPPCPAYYALLAAPVLATPVLAASCLLHPALTASCSLRLTVRCGLIEPASVGGLKSSGRALTADRLAVSVLGQLTPVMHQETPRAGELVRLPRNRLGTTVPRWTDPLRAVPATPRHHLGRCRSCWKTCPSGVPAAPAGCLQ